MVGRVLIIKTSSLGDILHTLPALTDAYQKIPGISFDWVVEEAFREVPAWHPAVAAIIPVAFRRWRRQALRGLMQGEFRAAIRRLRRCRYEQVIDAQGLIKSALTACLARGPRAGMDRNSVRESLAALAYHHKYPVARDQHAVQRVRRLFAAALHYELPDTPPDYALGNRFLSARRHDYLVFLHGTTWPSKHWPDPYWQELALLAAGAGMQVRLPWGNREELLRARRMADTHERIKVMPRLTLADLAMEIAGAYGVVGVDTGPVQLAAALGTPCITLYGATDPMLIGTLGNDQVHLQSQFRCAPCLQRRCHYRGSGEVAPACYTDMTPWVVWERLNELLAVELADGQP